MNTIQKVILGALSVLVLGAAGFLIADRLPDSKPDQSDSPENIARDYEDLLAEAERLQMFVGANCDDKKDTNKKIKEMEEKLADLADRKKQWLDNVPKLPDVEPEDFDTKNPLGRPGSEVPELSSDAPPLPDFDPEVIEVPGSQVPELSSDVPPLPDISLESTEFIPEMPEINPGRPGSEVPELSSDVPPLPDISPESIDVLGSQVPELSSDVPELPEIDENNVINPDEYIFRMDDSERKIINALQALKDLCQEEEPVKKVISDKCSDACQRYKDCAAYTEDVTPTDLDDAYNTCMEECATWPKEAIKCINAVDVKTPNDCVSFVQCQLPQFYEEKYLK
jgi:hypothetical protein